MHLGSLHREGCRDTYQHVDMQFTLVMVLLCRSSECGCFWVRGPFCFQGLLLCFTSSVVRKERYKSAGEHDFRPCGPHAHRGWRNTMQGALPVTLAS